MRLFDYHGNILYTVTTDSEAIVIKNILQKVNIRSAIKNTTEVFVEYELMDGDRPEIIAHKVYGSVNYHWVVLLMNDIVNPYYDWVMSDTELEKFIDKQYGVVNRNALHHYVDTDGEEITDEGNIVQLAGTRKYFVSNLQNEIECNDAKRKIKILDPKYLNIVEDEIKKLLR